MSVKIQQILDPNKRFFARPGKNSGSGLADDRFVTLRDHLFAAEADESTYQSHQQQFRDRRAAARQGGEMRVDTFLISRDGLCIEQTTTTVEVRPGDYQRIMAEADRAYRCRRALRDVPMLHIEMGG